MTITARTLTRTLATLAIVATTVSNVLQGTPGAAYAAHVDGGCALVHCHGAATHASSSRTRQPFPAHGLCARCGWRHPEASLTTHPGLYRGKAGSTMAARQRDTAVEAAVLAQKVTTILASYRPGHILRCDIVCR